MEISRFPMGHPVRVKDHHRPHGGKHGTIWATGPKWCVLHLDPVAPHLRDSTTNDYATIENKFLEAVTKGIDDDGPRAG